MDVPGATPRTFEILGCLGRGGYGEVYLANLYTHSGLVQRVAVKVLHASLGASAEAVLRLREEARLLATLNHPVIPRVYDVARLAGRPAMITEYIPGVDLRGAMLLPDFQLRCGLETVAGIASALAAAWATRSPQGDPLRLVHRDIKPGNIRVSIHGQPHLLDFGIARAEDANREVRTETHAILGTLGFMAPERFGKVPEDSRGDVFSLGCVMFEVATGQPLFDGLSLLEHAGLSAHAARFDAVVGERLQRVSDAHLRELLGAVLAHDPARRPHPDRLATILEDFAARLGGLTLRRWASRHAWPDDGAIPGELTGLRLVEGEGPELAAAGDLSPPSVPTFEPVGRPPARPDPRPPSRETPEREARILPPQPPVSAPPQGTAAGRATAAAGLLAASLVGVGALATTLWLGEPTPRLTPTDAAPSTAPAASTAPAEAPAAPSVGFDAEPPPPASTRADASAPVDAGPGDPPRAGRARRTRTEAPLEPAVSTVGAATPAVPPALIDDDPLLTPVRVAPIAAREAATPAVEEIQAPSGRWSAAAGVRTQLRSGGRSFSPGEVPPGRYAIWADFGGGFADAGGGVDVRAGASVVVTCQMTLRTCSAR